MPILRPILSKQNASLKRLRAAWMKPASKGDALVAIEGFHLVQEALASKITVNTIFVAAGRESALAALNIPPSVNLLAVPEDILIAAVSTESPQPIAALIEPPFWTWENLLDQPDPLLVVIAGLQDPGNLGTILRSAEAFRATGAILLPGTVSPWNPKSVRASAGSIFRLPLIHSTVEHCFQYFENSNIQSLAAMAHHAHSLERVSLSHPTAFVIGSEGAGLDPAIAARCSQQITIPCPGPVESLNAAVAASILLYQASQSRRSR